MVKFENIEYSRKMELQQIINNPLHKSSISDFIQRIRAQKFVQLSDYDRLPFWMRLLKANELISFNWAPFWAGLT